MKTIKWIEKKEPCSDGLEWFMANRHRCKTDVEIIELLIKEDHLDWANWGLTRLLNKKQCILYAIFAAKQVLPIFEDRYDKDKRPRKAVEAAEAVLNSNTERNRDAAHEAARDAIHAARAATWDNVYAFDEDTACASACAAQASYATAKAAETTYAASCGAAACAAACAAEAAIARRACTDEHTFRKILKYGLNLKKGEIRAL